MVGAATISTYLVWQGFHISGRSHLPQKVATFGLLYKYINSEACLLGTGILAARGSELYHGAGQKQRRGHAGINAPSRN